MPRQRFLEFRGEPAGGQPKLQSRIHQELQLPTIEHSAANRDRRAPWNERPGRKGLLIVLIDQVEDLSLQLLRFPAHCTRNSLYQVMVRFKPSSRLNNGAQFSIRRARSALRYCARISLVASFRTSGITGDPIWHTIFLTSSSTGIAVSLEKLNAVPRTPESEDTASASSR